MTLGGEGLVSGLPDAGVRPGFSNGGGAGDSDCEGDGEADFDGRAGSTSPAGDSGSDSDRMMLGAHGGIHKHMKQRAEVSMPTERIPQDRRGKSKRRWTKGRNEGKVQSKKKERLNSGVGSGTDETKKSRNKSSAAAAKGRVAAWLGGIDPAVPPQEEIIPPSPSAVRDLDDLPSLHHPSSNQPKNLINVVNRYINQCRSSTLF